MNKIQYCPDQEIKIGQDIRFHPEMTWGEKMFYAEIVSLSSKSKCYYSPVKLAELFHVSSITISTWIKNLCNLGYLEVVVDLNDKICHQIIKPKIPLH